MNQNRKMQLVGKEAIVIGASIGGILAARVLADAFERVTIIERDAFPLPGEQRKGVPQGRHAHGLLASGFKIMSDLFPGLKDVLVAQGGMEGSTTSTVRWNMGPGSHRQFESDLVGILVSRPLLEANLRERLMALPNVRAISGCDVLGLVTSADKRQVTGARILRRREGSVEEVLPASLVVDASGRGSRSQAWLEALGYERAHEEHVRINFSYTTRIYRRSPSALNGDRGLIVGATTETRRAGVLLAQEGDCWIVTLGGYMGDAAPGDEAGFLQFARTLCTPELAEVIQNAEPIGEAVQFKIPSSQRRHFEKLARFPTGYLVFGDAICSFNPIYGQGMSVAAQEAVVLRACLQDGLEGLAQRFFQQAAKVIDIPWSIAVGGDLRFPEVEGPRSGQIKFINWYLERLHAVARYDKTVALAFHKVTNLTAPPPSLMKPGIALRILIGHLFPPQEKKAAVQEEAQAA